MNSGYDPEKDTGPLDQPMKEGARSAPPLPGQPALPGTPPVTPKEAETIPMDLGAWEVHA